MDHQLSAGEATDKTHIVCRDAPTRRRLPPPRVCFHGRRGCRVIALILGLEDGLCHLERLGHQDGSVFPHQFVDQLLHGLAHGGRRLADVVLVVYISKDMAGESGGGRRISVAHCWRFMVGPQGVDFPSLRRHDGRCRCRLIWMATIVCLVARGNEALTTLAMRMKEVVELVNKTSRPGA